MPIRRERWASGLAALLCLGSVIALHRPASWTEPTAWRFSRYLASTMDFALQRDTLLVPSGIELIGAYRGCPSQMLFHFNGHSLDKERFLQRNNDMGVNDIGVMAARLSYPLAATLTNKERSDCKKRSRMHPFPGWEDERSAHTAG